MADCIVIGGGPAGMMAAISAGISGKRVILIERNSVLGKKLLLTGNGRCNLSHKVISEKDVDELDLLKNSNDYIDISISNNLLISNRKLRRKLEMILENGSFASVDYIDDIVLTPEEEEKKKEEEEQFDEANLDISIQLDYGDYIKEYILKQKYDNEKFKSGVMTEFDEVIRIYNENFSSKKD